MIRQGFTEPERRVLRATIDQRRRMFVKRTLRIDQSLALLSHSESNVENLSTRTQEYVAGRYGVGRTPKISDSSVVLLHCWTQTGWTAKQVAGMFFNYYGFKSAWTMQCNLYKRFREMGLRIHDNDI